MIPACVESRKATVETRIAAIVAPASGIRSRIPTTSPSASAYGTPTSSSTSVEAMAAMRLISRLPVT